MGLTREIKALAAAITATAAAAAVPLSVGLVAKAPSSPAPVAQVAEAPSAADAAAGQHLFLMNCAHCHGDDAQGHGEDDGPDLADLHKSDARIHGIVTAGIKGEMPSFGKKLGDVDIREITAFLRTVHEP
jgi:mono/diheme cytochrome c family protein